MSDTITERMVANAVAFRILDDYEEDESAFSIWSTTTEGNVIYATGADEEGDHFEIALEVRFT